VDGDYRRALSGRLECGLRMPDGGCVGMSFEAIGWGMPLWRDKCSTPNLLPQIGRSPARQLMLHLELDG